MNDWAHDLVRRMCDQVDETEAAAGERFPLYLHNGQWKTSARGSWTGGFWAGLLTLRKLATGAGDIAPVRDRLDVWADADTVLRGMIFWYGSGAERLGLIAPRPSTAKVTDDLASSLAPELGAIPWGTALAADAPGYARTERPESFRCWRPTATTTLRTQVSGTSLLRTALRRRSPPWRC